MWTTTCFNNLSHYLQRGVGIYLMRAGRVASAGRSHARITPAGTLTVDSSVVSLLKFGAKLNHFLGIRSDMVRQLAVVSFEAVK